MYLRHRIAEARSSHVRGISLRHHCSSSLCHLTSSDRRVPGEESGHCAYTATGVRDDLQRRPTERLPGLFEHPVLPGRAGTPYTLRGYVELLAIQGNNPSACYAHPDSDLRWCCGCLIFGYSTNSKHYQPRYLAAWSHLRIYRSLCELNIHRLDRYVSQTAGVHKHATAAQSSAGERSIDALYHSFF